MIRIARIAAMHERAEPSGNRTHIGDLGSPCPVPLDDEPQKSHTHAPLMGLAAHGLVGLELRGPHKLLAMEGAAIQPYQTEVDPLLGPACILSQPRRQRQHLLDRRATNRGRERPKHLGPQA